MSWFEFRRKRPRCLRASGQVEDELLLESAKRLQLDVEMELKVPTHELVKKTGYEPVVLRRVGILPQPYQAGYRLVISDPSLINRTAFESLGITLCLSSARNIDEIWRRYASTSLCDEEERQFQEYRDYTARSRATKLSSPGDIFLPIRN